MATETTKFDGIVRPLIREDIPSIKPILETWVRNPQTGEILTEEVINDLISMADSLNKKGDKEYFVAQTTQGKIIGTMGLSHPKLEIKPFATTPKPVELINAYVDINFRGGKGVGSALVSKLAERAATGGFTEILLDSGPRYRVTGWGFWDKQPGFQRIGIAKELYGLEGDAPVWQRILAQID